MVCASEPFTVACQSRKIEEDEQDRVRWGFFYFVSDFCFSFPLKQWVLLGFVCFLGILQTEVPVNRE
jgi:hypothetical protein